MPRSPDTRLGHLAVARGLVTREQLATALRRQEAESPGPALAEVLVAAGLLTRAQVQELLGALDTVPALPAPSRDTQDTVSDFRLPATPALVTPPTGAAPPAALVPAPAPVPARRFGKYELLEELGHGGMGVVYKAWRPDLRAQFAVKVLLAGPHAAPEALQRFEREAQACARLRHPGIVAVHDFGIEEGRPYFAMDFIEGVLLSDVLSDPARAGFAAPGGPRGLAARDAARIGHEVADAMEHAHRQGVVHRDLKPHNVLLDRNGRARVFDFGLAKLLDRGDATAASALSRTGMVMGTLAYMAPEQAGGDVHRIDERTDIWAIGAILYEMTTGIRPFAGASDLELIGNILSAEPARPRRLNPSIPVDLETILLKAMAREPARRYPRAADLAADLRHFLDGEAIRARREAWWERAVRWGRRRKALVGLGSGLLLALAIAAAARWETARGRREQDRLRQEQEDLQRDMLGKASQAVLEYENIVMSVRLDAAGRRALARQPLAALDLLLERQRDFGPLYSWRGMTKALMGGPELDPAQVEADLDRGCALTPSRAVVWFLRGMYHSETYARARSFPGISSLGRDAVFAPPPPESAAETRRRERGLADLERMVREAAHDPSFGVEEARLGQAMVALARGGDAEYRRVLELAEAIQRPKARRLKGQALFYLKRFEESAATLGHTLKDWPEDLFAWRYLGVAEYAAALRVSARGADPREGYNKAILAFGVELLRDPEGAADRFVRGSVYRSLGEAEAARGLDPRETYGKAVADFEAALRRNPEYADAYNGRGAVYGRLGEAEAARGSDPRETYGKAIADFGAALRRDPESADAYSNRGNVYFVEGQAEATRGLDPRETYGKAVADLGSALRRNPEHVGACNARGLVYLFLGEAEVARGLDPRATFAKAVADFDAALRCDPEFELAFNGRGAVYSSLGVAEAARGLDPRKTYGKAVADFDAALRRNPEFADAYDHRGTVYRHLGEAEAARGLDPRRTYGKAVADFDAALRRNPELAHAYNNRGNVYLRLGQVEAVRGLDPRETYGKAEADYRAALARHDVQAYMNLGILYLTQRRYDEAVAAFEAGARALPGAAAWARARITETRALQQAAPAAPAAPSSDPWAGDFALAAQAVQAGDYPAARTRYEKGLALLAESLGTLAEAERAKRLADAPLRALLVSAHYDLACALALASAGRDGPEASGCELPPAAAVPLRDQAFSHLAQAAGLGWGDANRLASDSDLEPLHADPRWQELLRRLAGGH